MQIARKCYILAAIQPEVRFVELFHAQYNENVANLLQGTPAHSSLAQHVVQLHDAA